MMRHVLMVAIFVLIVPATVVRAQVGFSEGEGAPSSDITVSMLTIQEIEEAIHRGMDGKKLVKECNAGGGFGGALRGIAHKAIAPTSSGRGEYRVHVEGPVGRVMREAREAKARYERLAPEDLSGETLSHTFSVIADPKPFRNGGAARPQRAENIVLRGKDSDTVLHPVTVLSMNSPPQAGSPAVPGLAGIPGLTNFSYDDRIIAYFNFDEVASLDEDFDVIVLIQGQERRCKVKRSDREKLR